MYQSADGLIIIYKHLATNMSIQAYCALHKSKRYLNITASCTGNGIESVVGTLSNSLIEIHSWCLQKNLMVHPGKGEAMHMIRVPFLGK